MTLIHTCKPLFVLVQAQLISEKIKVFVIQMCRFCLLYLVKTGYYLKTDLPQGTYFEITYYSQWLSPTNIYPRSFLFCL